MKSVKIPILLLLWLLLLAPGLCFAAGLGYMRISFMKGDVQVKTPEADDWGFAAINSPLAEGDQLWVPAGSRVELQLSGGSFVRLDGGSSLQILSLDRDSSQLYLAQGRAYVYYAPPTGSVLQLDTPDASTRAFERAVYRVDMGNEFTDVSVYKGAVDAENRVGAARINAGELLSLSGDSDAEIAPMGPSDPWEVWNKSRNRRMHARGGKSSRYLPEELTAYAPDFDGNGRWVYVADYGNVWTPTVSVSADWSPYRDGRWVWRGGEYVWIPYEAWGWAPYHYGRWAFVSGLGWCWVPPAPRAVYWGPGYVGWITTSDHVAWVPLAPGETYYGRGYYGPNSVNTTSVNVTEVRVTNVYRNVYVNNGVTVVRRETFATPTPSRVRADSTFVRSNLLAAGRLNAGAPQIRPSRTSSLLARPVPQAKLPPAPVRSIQVPALRRERVLVREQQRSVLAPNATPRSLPVRSVEGRRNPGTGRPTLNRGISPAPPGTGRVPQSERGRPAQAPVPVKPQVGAPSERRSSGTEDGSGGRPVRSRRGPQLRPEGSGTAAPPVVPPAATAPTSRIPAKMDATPPAVPERGRQQRWNPAEGGAPATPGGAASHLPERGGRAQHAPAQGAAPTAPVPAPQTSPVGAERGKRQQHLPGENVSPVPAPAAGGPPGAGTVPVRRGERPAVPGQGGRGKGVPAERKRLEEKQGPATAPETERRRGEPNLAPGEGGNPAVTPGAAERGGQPPGAERRRRGADQQQ